MTDNSNHSINGFAQSVVENATHYVDSVSAMAVDNDLRATRDIISPSGIKHVARGTRIDSHLREKLCGHYLPGAALEKNFSITGGVTPESLAIDTGHLIDDDPWLKRLETMSGDPCAMRYDASRLKLPCEVLFRLTLAHDQRPVLYRHLLSVAIISHYIALRLGLTQATTDNLLIAALCHDLGELYVDPAILESEHRVTDEERCFIYAHPIVGWMIAHELPNIDSEVTNAIIQHHERLDGSGYPHGKNGDAIGLSGRILATADVSASIMARFSDHRRLSTLLRLNHNKYDAKIVDLILNAITQEATSAGQLECGAIIMTRLTGFASVLNGWSQLNAATKIAREVSCEFISERMFNLRVTVLQCGFDPDSFDMLLKLAQEDVTIADEMTAIMDELQFQLADIGREFDRHLSILLNAINPLILIALTDWRRQLRDYLEC